MAAVGGVPKLSSLQAQLRKSSAPKPSSAANVVAQGLKRPAEDPLGGVQAKKIAITKTAPVGKAPIMKSAPTAAPGVAGAVKSPGPGLQAKLPPPSPPMPQVAGVPAKPAPPTAAPQAKKANEIEDIKALQAKLAALKAKANSLQSEVAKTTANSKAPAAGVAATPSGAPSMTKASATAPPSAVPQQKAAGSAAKSAMPAGSAAKSAAVLPVKRPPGVPPAAVANGQQAPGAPTQETVTIDVGTSEALKTFAVGLKSHQGKSKLVLLARLVEAVHQDLSIEQTIYFQKLCRKKVEQKAAQDGVQLSAPAPAPAPAAAPVASATKSAPAAVRPPLAATPKVAAPARPAPAAAPAPTAAPAWQPATAAVGSANGAAASPPESPPPGDNSPLLALVGELTEEPVCEEGLLNDVRLNQVLKRLWDGVAQRPKDWLAAWQAMLIPGERHAEVLQKFLNMAFVQTEGHNPEEAPMIIAELVKAHKIKMTVVEEVLVAFGHNLDGVLAMNEEAWHVYAYVLLHVYPKPAKSGWGWSRVGWTWLGWWKFVEKTIASLETSKAFDVLSMLLRLVQDREGLPLSQAWSEAGKIKQVTAKLGELGACSEPEVISRLSVEGITLEG